jgi:hypothetical protein
MHQDEEIHAEILRVFREYFEENQRWLNEGTKASAIRLRQRLSEIRRLCSDRRVAVREWARIKEADLRAKEDLRQAQKRAEGKSGTDN